MKKNLFLKVIYLFVLCCLIGGCSKEPVSTEVGDAVLGDFSAMDMNGNPVNQEILLGKKLTMINIWGTFCGPCIKEMPELGELNTEFGDDFQIIGIVIDVTDRNGNILSDKREAAKAIIETTGADYLHLLPSTSLNKAYLSGVSAVPETIFVDENGCQIGENYTGAKTKEQWKSIIEQLLKSLP